MAYVKVGKDGKAPSTAKVGDIVQTAGGDFKITGTKPGGGFASALVTDTGSLMSNLVKPSGPNVTQTIQQLKTGGSAGVVAVEPWQENMKKTYEGGAGAIALEIARAQNVLYSGTGTSATYRYLSQMNALKDGASLADVFAGKYDGYQGQGQNWNLQKNIENQAAVPLPDVWTKRDELSLNPGGDKDGSFLPSAVYSAGLPGNAMSAVQSGLGQSTDGFVNTGVMVLAGAAVLMAVAKLFGK